MRVYAVIALGFISLIQLSSCTQRHDKINRVENNLQPHIAVEGEGSYTLADRMAYYHIKGLSIAVIQNYKMMWAKGYGWADDDLKIPVTAQTLFQAGSISKSLNSIGVLKL